MKRLSLFLLVIVLFALGSVAVARAAADSAALSANYAIQPNSLASGGQAASSANYAISSTVGEPPSARGLAPATRCAAGFGARPRRRWRGCSCRWSGVSRPQATAQRAGELRRSGRAKMCPNKTPLIA